MRHANEGPWKMFYHFQKIGCNGRVGFTYKDNKTYPNLFEFLAYITNREIPIEIKNCHLGPGEIVVLRDNKGDAIGDLILSTNEIVNEIKTKFNN